jgi:hypothetical protein
VVHGIEIRLMDDNFFAKVIGVLSGAFLSLSYDPPRSRAGFFRRGASSLLFGWIFGYAALGFLEWPETYNHIVAAFCLASMLSWSAIGLLRKLVEAYKREG